MSWILMEFRDGPCQCSHHHCPAPFTTLHRFPSFSFRWWWKRWLLVWFFWGVFLWQHPRVPWCVALTWGSLSSRWGGGGWRMVAVLTHIRWGVPHPEISPCSQEHPHRLPFPLPQVTVLCSQQLEDLLVLGLGQKFCSCLCWGNWGDWHEVSTQPLNVFAFPHLLGQCTEITVLSSLTYYWEMFNA